VAFLRYMDAWPAMAPTVVHSLSSADDNEPDVGLVVGEAFEPRSRCSRVSVSIVAVWRRPVACSPALVWRTRFPLLPSVCWSACPRL
jgi:hypothetical protein